MWLELIPRLTIWVSRFKVQGWDKKTKQQQQQTNTQQTTPRMIKRKWWMKQESERETYTHTFYVQIFTWSFVSFN